MARVTETEWTLDVCDTAEGGDLTAYAQVTANLDAVRLFELPPAAKTAKLLLTAGLATKQAGAVHAPAKPHCDDPQLIWKQWDANGIYQGGEVSFFAPCRRCPKCLQFRALQWRDRIKSELIAHQRSWFVTLTFNPVELAKAEMRARGRFSVCDTTYWQVSDYLKRLRHHWPHSLRFCAVYEEGEKTDRPHWHLVIHDGTGLLTRRALEFYKVRRGPMRGYRKRLWKSHLAARLIRSSGLSGYLTKYMTKDISHRPRASVGYGKSSFSGKVESCSILSPQKETNDTPKGRDSVCNGSNEHSECAP